VGVGERIAEERKRKGLSQAAFAKLVGVSFSSQRRYENGSRDPDTAYLDALWRIGVNVRYVVGYPKATPGEIFDELLFGGSNSLDSALLAEILEGLEDELSVSGQTIAHAKKAQVVAMLYRSFMGSGNVDRALIKEAVKLAVG